MKCGTAKKAGEFYYIGAVPHSPTLTSCPPTDLLDSEFNRRDNINPFTNCFDGDVRNRVVEYIRREIVPNTPSLTYKDVLGWTLLFHNVGAMYSMSHQMHMSVAPATTYIAGLVLKILSGYSLYSFKLSRFVQPVYESGVLRLDRSGLSYVTIQEWFQKPLPDVPLDQYEHPANEELWRCHRNTLQASIRAVVKNMFEAKQAQAQGYASYFLTTFVDPLSNAERMAYFVETNPKNLQAVITNYRRWSNT